MADVLNMQDGDQTPAEEKASNVSVLWRACHNSYISVSLCMVK